MENQKGRKLFQLIKAFIKGTDWEEAVFPKAKVKRRIYNNNADEIFNAYADHYETKLGVMEDIFNEFLFDDEAR